MCLGWLRYVGLYIFHILCLFWPLFAQIRLFIQVIGWKLTSRMSACSFQSRLLYTFELVNLFYLSFSLVKTVKCFFILSSFENTPWEGVPQKVREVRRFGEMKLSSEPHCDVFEKQFCKCQRFHYTRYFCVFTRLSVWRPTYTKTSRSYTVGVESFPLNI